MDKLKILLLQARDPDDPMAPHEHRCFAEQCGLNTSQFEIHDLLQGPPDRSELDRCDAVMVGGSGDYYVSRGDLPHFDAVLDFFAHLVDTGRPTFASCFGFHFLARALGGDVAFDGDNTEVGTYELKLTPDGVEDELFGILPAEFMAQEGHKDRAIRFGEHIPNLASSEQSPFQALRIPGQPVWATQFHPELTRRTNLDRYEFYLDNYAPVMTDAERQAAVDRFVDSDTAGLLPRFLELVFD